MASLEESARLRNPLGRKRSLPQASMVSPAKFDTLSLSVIARRLWRALQPLDQRRIARDLTRARHPKEPVEIFSMDSQSSNDDGWVPFGQAGSLPGSAW